MKAAVRPYGLAAGLLASRDFYAFDARGVQFVGLAYLPCRYGERNAGLHLDCVWRCWDGFAGERPSLQWLGHVAAIGGGLLYFYPVQIPLASPAGGLWQTVGRHNAGSGRFGAVDKTGRGYGCANHHHREHGHWRNAAAGGVSSRKGFPLCAIKLAIIGWLALVNTAAFAFTLWNVRCARCRRMSPASSTNNGVQIPIWR
ncbi:MAG: hypothetical protein H6656_10185 [Ardenticatenaceae bacterium]|nr:hypothetical protein [Ardenticatenaceae bacterium]